MSVSEDECCVLVSGRPMQQEREREGLRLRSSGSSTEGSVTSPSMGFSTPTIRPYFLADHKNAFMQDGVIPPSTVRKPKPILKSQVGPEDSGYQGYEDLSLLDSPNIVLSSSCPIPQFVYTKSDIQLSTLEDSDIDSSPPPVTKAGADGIYQEGVRKRMPWNLHFLSGLVLIVLLGACGFGLLLSFRHLDGRLFQSGEEVGGKYRSIQFARERIEEEARKVLMEKAADNIGIMKKGNTEDSMQGGNSEEVGDSMQGKNRLDVAGKYRDRNMVGVEARMENDLDYHDDTNFRAGKDSAFLGIGRDSAFLRLKREQEMDDGETGGGEGGFRLVGKREAEKGAEDGGFRKTEVHIENAKK